MYGCHPLEIARLMVLLPFSVRVDGGCSSPSAGSLQMAVPNLLKYILKKVAVVYSFKVRL